MRTLVKLSDEATGPDGLYPVEAVHSRPDKLTRTQREAFDFTLHLYPKPEPKDGYERRLFGADSLYYYERTAGDENTEPGPWALLYDVFIEAHKSKLGEQANEQYMACLERGFTFDDGQFPATGPKRARVTEYVASINAGKGLPQGKSTLTFRDMGGVGHDLDAQGIIDLGATGSDLVDQADDRYEELQASVEAATSQSDLDTIDPTSGWPNL